MNPAEKLSDYIYVYCVVDGLVNEKFGKIGIGGQGDEVFSRSCRNITSIVSYTIQDQFDRNEENVIAHQRVVQKVFSRYPAVPLPFSTVLENEAALDDFLKAHYGEFQEKLKRLQTVFQAAKPEPSRELVEDALAQSLTSTLKIRQLRDEISKLRAAPVDFDDSGLQKLTDEVRWLRDELRALRSIQDSVASCVRKRPNEVLNSKRRFKKANSRELTRQVSFKVTAPVKTNAAKEYRDSRGGNLRKSSLDPTRLPTCAALFPEYFGAPNFADLKD